MELIRDNVKVEWEAIGEGLHGDYNPNNPEDIELLRFYVSVLRDGVWEEKEDASYCTNFPVSATDEQKMAGLKILMKRFYDALSADIDVSVKKLSEDMSWIGLDTLTRLEPSMYLDKPVSMDLREFLSYFDFDYDIVSAGDKMETRIRQNLIEDGELSSEYIDKDLICLIDKQDAYFGDIDQERYPINQDSVKKIIDRMDTYIQDSVISEFVDALEDRNVDTSNMSLGDMLSKCKELKVGTGEVSYYLAEAINQPDLVFIKEVLEQENTKSNQKESLDNIVKAASNRAANSGSLLNGKIKNSGKEPEI